MFRKCVESDRYAQHSGSGDEDVACERLEVKFSGKGKNSRILTKAERDCQNLSSYTTEHEVSGIIDTVNVAVSLLESSDDVTRPRRDDADGYKADDTRNKAQLVEATGDRKDTKTDHDFHHDGDGSKQRDLFDGQSQSNTKATARVPYIAIIGFSLSNLTEDGIVFSYGSNIHSILCERVRERFVLNVFFLHIGHAQALKN